MSLPGTKPTCGDVCYPVAIGATSSLKNFGISPSFKRSESRTKKSATRSTLRKALCSMIGITGTSPATTAMSETTSLFLIPIGLRIAGGAVIFERQELARHGDFDAVALGIGQ